MVSENSGWSPIVGRWEPEAQALFSAVVRAGNTVYDLGANNGIHSLLFSKLTGTKGKVFSFEPLQKNCEEIKTNYSLNSITNITIVQNAVGEKTGTMQFHLGLHDKQGSLVGIGRESGESLTVNIITLDEFIAKGNPQPDFLKIDIEGAESMALAGFSKSIDNIRPLMFIELHTPEQDALVGKFLADHGYTAWRLEEGANDPSIGVPGLKKIQDLTKPYPAPDGIWGTILAVHPEKLNTLKQN
ncbi:MAG: FkbM family methyltransferase [Sphingobacteriales bacterium]|nr:MAG: FkbM family methyltransferase [Sphingobacteriales bacterium]